MLPNGVTVAQLILVQFVEVRILIGQPFFFVSSTVLAIVLDSGIRVSSASFIQR